APWPTCPRTSAPPGPGCGPRWTACAGRVDDELIGKQRVAGESSPASKASPAGPRPGARSARRGRRLPHCTADRVAAGGLFMALPFPHKRPARGTGHPARPPSRVRLVLEALEDRTTPSTFTVTTLADSGAGSLRQAVLDANAHPGADTIRFANG